ncbi:hypothetical protein [Streptomyces sp. NPDC086989]
MLTLRKSRLEWLQQRLRAACRCT